VAREAECRRWKWREPPSLYPLFVVFLSIVRVEVVSYAEKEGHVTLKEWLSVVVMAGTGPIGSNTNDETKN